MATLEQLLEVMDRAAANIAKLEAVWQRAHPHFPSGPAVGTNREYEDLCRHWRTLLGSLPPINGWTVSEELPDIDAVGRAFLDYWDIGEPSFNLLNDLDRPAQELDEYRFQLAQARRQAAQGRLNDLVTTIDTVLPQIVRALPEDPSTRVDSSLTVQVEAAFKEANRLLGDTTERRGRWHDMSRHLSLGQPHDWRDIQNLDWPDVRANLETMGLTEFDPVPIDTDVDLGVAAASNPTGGVTIGLRWAALDEDGLERVLFDMLRGLTNYQNVQWLMKTRAPDRGRDLSLERLIPDASGTTRTERVIVQAKHWLSKSVDPMALEQSLAAISMWEPPPVRTLIIATSGRFTADAVTIAEKHNNEGKAPYIELWPDSRLEALLAQRPDLIAANGPRS